MLLIFSGPGSANGDGVKVSTAAPRFIARQGFDLVYGADPLRRYLARQVEHRHGRAPLAGTVPDGAVIEVDVAADDSRSATTCSSTRRGSSA